jgi:hypothetical protein
MILAKILREVVDTQAVEVPVVMSTIPLVPDAFTPSRNAPERVILFAKRFEEVAFVVEAFVAKIFVAVALPSTELVKFALIAKRLVAVALVVDALVAKSVVAVAFPRIELVNDANVATRLEMKELEVVALVVEALRAKRLVAVALMKFALFAKRFDEVAFVVEAFTEKRFVAVALVNVEDTEKKLEAVTRPLGATEKIEEPVEEATLKIVLADPAVPCTLRVIVDEVAPTPSTTPLSMRVLVPRVLFVAQRVA